MMFSIFKNDTQIAWFRKNDIVIFAGDEYQIFANSDVDIPLLLAICISLDHHLNRKNKGFINIEIGRLGLVKKAFDEDWKPY